jgi:pimeloyl-ACP methyl ester carboxylesterase
MRSPAKGDPREPVEPRSGTVSSVATFGFVHGAGDVGWYWHLVEAELAARGHCTVAPDLPVGDDELTLGDYANEVTEALQKTRGHSPIVLVGQSFGAFTAPLVADRVRADLLVLVAGMVPAPGESPNQWWENTGYEAARDAAAARDGGLTGHDDPFVTYYHDVPRALAQEALSKERDHPSRAASANPWPLDVWPDVPTRFVLCAQDRLLPKTFLQQLVSDRLHIVPDEIDAGHCPALSRPRELAGLLELYIAA